MYYLNHFLVYIPWFKEFKARSQIENSFCCFLNKENCCEYFKNFSQPSVGHFWVNIF